MIINLDYYKGEDLYCDGDTEKEILEYEEKYQEKDFEKIFEKDLRWPIFYHLTSIRKNILNWYPMKKDAEVLEIGAGMGAITSTLCEKAGKVTSVELSKQRAASIANRCKDKENLEIIVGNLNEIDFKDRKFDYITLIGVLEYAVVYTETANPYVDFLNNVKKLLKPDGKLLIAIENKFGMKYWLGAPEDHTNKKYDGITGYENKNFAQTFGKQEIKELLCECNLKNINFYYPLPDYKLPSVIFSDKYLPTEKTIENYTPYYYEGTETEFDEIKAYKEVIKNKMFDFFANSFFIECSESKIDTQIDLSNIKLIPIGENSKKFYEKDYTKKDKQNQIETLQMEIKELKNKIEAIEDSRTWKMTKPLRDIRKKLK